VTDRNPPAAPRSSDKAATNPHQQLPGGAHEVVGQDSAERHQPDVLDPVLQGRSGHGLCLGGRGRVQPRYEDRICDVVRLGRGCHNRRARQRFTSRDASSNDSSGLLQRHGRRRLGGIEARQENGVCDIGRLGWRHHGCWGRCGLHGKGVVVYEHHPRASRNAPVLLFGRLGSRPPPGGENQDHRRPLEHDKQAAHALAEVH
jgi:hypothetical protein